MKHIEAGWVYVLNINSWGWQDIGKVVSRDNIMMKLWESDDFIDDNTLTAQNTTGVTDIRADYYHLQQLLLEHSTTECNYTNSIIAWN